MTKTSHYTDNAPTKEQDLGLDQAAEGLRPATDLAQQSYLDYFAPSEQPQPPKPAEQVSPMAWRSIQRVVATTPPEPCAYIEGRLENKLIIPMVTGDAEEASIYNRAGFRRSHQYFYRPTCLGCDGCQPLRILTADYKPSKSDKRLLKRHKALSPEIVANQVTTEHWVLFRDYVRNRHGGGGMATMDRGDFAHMVEHGGSNTALVEWRDPSSAELVAAALVDLMDDGLSAVYSYYDISDPKDAFGRYMILSMVEVCSLASLPYLYLGFWVQGAETMDYKAAFKPHEVFKGSVWQTG